MKHSSSKNLLILIVIYNIKKLNRNIADVYIVLLHGNYIFLLILVSGKKLIKN